MSKIMMKNIGIIFILGILLISFISADNNVYVNTNYHQKDIYNLTNVNSTNLYGKLQDINSSELEIQSDNKIGILDSFINLLIDNRVTQDFVRILGFYNTTEVDTEITNANSSVVNWVDDLFVRFTELFGYNYYNSTTLQNLTQLNNDLGIGNWTGDKPNYYTKEEVNTNISSANTSMKNYVDSGLNLKANLSGGNSFIGQQDFNGGWGSNGLSIINGNIYAQTGYFYNISSLQVNTLEVNGSVVPDVNNTFDIGNNTLKWRDAYFSRNVNATNFYQSGNPVLDLSNQYWNRSSTNVFLANTGDNVGIGTTTPDVKLQVNDTLQVGGEGAMGIGNQTGILYLGGSSAGPLWYTTSIRTINTDVTPSTWKPRMGFFTQAVGTHLAVNQTERMSILSDSGNVGIGTTTPDTTLDITTAGVNGIVLNEDTASPSVSSRLFFKNNNSAFAIMNADMLTFRYDATIGTTSGTAGMVMTSTGNVGIGTTSPTEKLTIDTGKILMTNAYQIGWGNTTQDYIYGTNATHKLIFATNSSERMIIDGSGKVGIGTTTPQTKLQISQNTELAYSSANFPAETTPGILLKNENTATNTNYIGTQYEVSGLSGYTGYGFIGMARASTYGDLVFGTRYSDGYAERMRITSGGNVGIGTTAPAEKLHVQGTGDTRIGIQSADGSDAVLEIGQDINAGKTWGLGLDDSNSDAFVLAYSASGNPSLTTNGLLTVTTSGNVGIGTTTPQNKLNVVGTINATGNITGNFIYGGIWNHNDSGSVLNIALSDTWYNLSGGVCNSYNGITCNNTTYNKFTIQIPGVYRIQYIGTGAGQNNHIYHAVVMVNGVKQNNTESHMLTAAGDVHSLSGLGYIHVLAGDVINAAVKDSTGTGDLTIYNTNLIMERVGN